MRRFLSACAVAMLCTLPSFAQAEVDTPASHVFLLDYNTGAVLLDKNAEQTMTPSSMSKLMTIYIVFEKLKRGELTLDTTFPVSENAWKKGGSKMFVRVGDTIKVRDLVQGVVVQSGNDACMVLAEGIAGTEEDFAKLMNRTAEQLGLKNSHFVNATGWPDPGHVMSAHDLATLATDIITTFPEYYHFFSEESFTYSGIRQPNRNLLIGRDGLGVDGLKTGHTEDGGYGMVTSAKEGERRLVLVVNGLSSEHERASESERLLRYGFSNFTDVELLKAGETVESAEVWFGDEPSVPLQVKDNVEMTLPRASAGDVSLTVQYKGPIPAPIAKGTHIADLHISVPDMKEQVLPLYAAEDVERLSWFRHIFRAARYYVTGS